MTQTVLPRFFLWGALLFGVVSSSPTPRKLFGEITSPNYPQPYPNSNISTWDIKVPKGFVVKLNFWHFDLEPSVSCLNDYVQITADEKDLGRFCGQQGSATGNHPGLREFVSKGNQMRLVFHSDSSNEENGTITPYKGFLAYYRPVVVNCGYPQNLTNGDFSYVREHGNNNYQSVISYWCEEPYYHMVTNSGNSTYTCSDQSTWVDQDGQENIPVCLPVCGLPSEPIQEQQRIIGGTQAKPGNFPWQVFFHSPKAAGVLISERWVLTAAHIFDYPSGRLLMYAGVTNTQPQELQKGDAVQLVEEMVIIHPEWTKVANPEERTNFDNDIALLRLKEPVKMGPKISPLCLPGSSPEYELTEGRLGYISGWGRTEKRNKASNLMMARIPVVNMEKCRSVKPKPPADSRTYQFTANMICAGDGKKDSCAGDSGGAYAITDPHNDSQYYVGGLVSWGPECGTYGLYTSMGRYRDWILETMRKYEEAQRSQE